MSKNNFELTLDTIAPICDIEYPKSGSTLNTNADVNVSLALGDAQYIKIWEDTSDKTSTAPSSAKWVEAVATYRMGFSQNGAHYVHVLFMDDVGNVSEAKHSGKIIYDTISPTIKSAYAADKDSGSHTITNDDTITIHIEASDNGSTLDYVTIEGPIDGGKQTVSAANFKNSIWDGDITFASGTTAGNKTFTVTAYDKAGNKTSKSFSINYDPNISAATLTLKATAADQDALPQYIRAETNSFVAVISTTDTDVVKYQLYGDLTGNGLTTSSTWKDWPTAGATSVTISNLSFTTGDGTKHVYMRVQDSAGNIYPEMTSDPVEVTRIYDATNPTVTLTKSGDVNGWIAAGSGSVNSCTISYTASDSPAGIDTISWALNGNGFTPTISNGSFTFSKANFQKAAIGANTISITVTDMAGNTTTKSVVVNIEDSFTITSVTLGGYAHYANDYKESTKKNLTATVKNDIAPASGRATLNVWTDSAASATDLPNGVANVTWSQSSQTVPNGSINKNFTDDSANNWLHVKAISKVGNVAYSHVQFRVDITAPSFSAAWTKHVNTLNNNISISGVADNLTGADKIRITALDGTTLASGATESEDENWVAIGSSYSIVLATGTTDGEYGVKVEIRDRAGNIADKNITWEYDKTTPAGSIVLKEADGVTAKASPSAVQTFIGQITFTSPDATDTYSTVQYRIYGDISKTADGTAISQANASWEDFKAATTSTTVLYCTANPANAPAEGVTKEIYIQIKDDAGNISEPVKTTFVYNPRAAELEIYEISHQRISCSHEPRKRLDDTQESPKPAIDLTDYADVVTFKVDSTQELQAWKVCAYTNYPAADVRGDAVTAMTQRVGSYSTSGYTATGVRTTSWTVVIDGQDFRNAVSTDGLHYIIVFGQNKAGTWSIAGTMYNASTDGPRKS